VSAPRIAAHLIVGPKEEPFLGALLASLNGAVSSAIVNDNAPDPSPHARVLEESALAARDALVVDRTPFADFASARNVCMGLHAERDAGEWVAFVDADEVHGEAVSRIASRLDRVPDDVGFVDGYTWHFFQSPDWYASIERRMAFHRFVPGARWEGKVHERLKGIDGRRIALPYVYGHYGHLVPPRRHAEKGRLYASLGQDGEVVAEDRLDSIDVGYYFRNQWPALLRFRGDHPPAARATIAGLRASLAAQFAQADAMVRAHQPPLRRARNLLEMANYELRWRGRGLDRLARELVRP